MAAVRHDGARLMFNAGIISAKKRPSPIGEVTLTTYSGNWICPAGVTSVCVVLVGAGGDGVQYPSSQRRAGGGGALVWKNNVSVIPGTAYPFTVGSTSIFGLTAGAGNPGSSSSSGGDGGAPGASGSPDGGYYGGYGGLAPNLSSDAVGGSAATYISNGAYGGGAGVGLAGVGSTGIYGVGGNSVYSSGSTAGGPGAIRIIWGDNRSFPNSAT
jgi:hypothetical protein